MRPAYSRARCLPHSGVGKTHPYGHPQIWESRHSTHTAGKSPFDIYPALFSTVCFPVTWAVRFELYSVNSFGDRLSTGRRYLRALSLRRPQRSNMGLCRLMDVWVHLCCPAAQIGSQGEALALRKYPSPEHSAEGKGCPLDEPFPILDRGTTHLFFKKAVKCPQTAKPDRGRNVNHMIVRLGQEALRLLQF